MGSVINLFRPSKPPIRASNSACVLIETISGLPFAFLMLGRERSQVRMGMGMMKYSILTSHTTRTSTFKGPTAMLKVLS